ncbi:hypothetical protein [Rathayibacter sp. VKM Ac-2927]|uniref:hypothetical protein n=1 Tax=Rathayibacter sp. VKM Ac-2927 TaxID=2929478 RepID=UPI001FB3B279|nr:hypothetical protein [Rathayibacter sp. VKM Ac-2927]MCJ1686208.1 hypothetical protein [Rathayibacter sp. VKM Ac-2927]
MSSKRRGKPIDVRDYIEAKGLGLYLAPPAVDKSQINFNPPTRYVPVRTLEVGDVVMEAPSYPVVVTRVGRVKDRNGGLSRCYVYGRYAWQHPSETPWKLGDFDPSREVRRAV